MLPEDCERARARASLALDCELSELERAHLRTHLDGCTTCATFAAGLREVTHELRAATLPAPRRPLAPRHRRRAPLAVALLVVVAAAGTGGLAGSLRTPPTAAVAAPQHTATAPRLPLRATV